MEAFDAYWAALEAADRPRALELIQSWTAAGWSRDRVLAELVIASQERVGDLWLEGRWNIAQEHAATAVNEAVVHWLMALLPPPPRDAPVVLVSCLQGERHALPALVVAEGLAARGLRVVFMGADPEPSALLGEILSLRPRAVLFSASLTSTLSTQKLFFRSIGATGIPLIVGGRAFGVGGLGYKRAHALGATAYAETMDEVMDLLETLPARTVHGNASATERDDEDVAWLQHYRAEIAPEVMRTLSLRHQESGPLSSTWPEVAEHIEHVLGCLAAAIVTGDGEIMVEVSDWLVEILTHRDLDPEIVDEIWDLLADALRGHAVARVQLAASRRTDGASA